MAAHDPSTDTPAAAGPMRPGSASENPSVTDKPATTRKVAKTALPTSGVMLFASKHHLERDDDPHNLARTVLREVAHDPRHIPMLRHYRGEVYRYRDGRWVRVSEKDLRAEVTGVIKASFVANEALGYDQTLRRVTQGIVGNTIQALASYIRISDEKEQPCWLGDGPPRDYVAVRNGLLDVGGPSPVLHDHNPNYFTLSALPVSFDPQAACETWLRFLDQIMESDGERIAMLQELFGYCLTPMTNQQKFWLFEGEGSNGKSVMLSLLTSLLGDENVSGVPLEQFGERFQLTMTLGKLANVCFEVGEIDRVAEGYLKQFTGGDRMYFDRKCLEGVHAYPTARLIMAANNRPKFSDRSGGLWRRMIVVPFRVIIPAEAQDKQLVPKLQAELSGILNWALEGRKRLLIQKAFTSPKVCEDAQADYKIESNPANVFLTQQCMVAPGRSIETVVAYTRYREWAIAGGYKPLDIAQFGKELKRVYPHIEKKRDSGGSRPWRYIGFTVIGTGVVEPPPLIDASDLHALERMFGGGGQSK
jgi:P4 family phage/plasmid primase-like protien